ncbi:thiol reductant ABC exporter subunit CydC [Mycolicibacterium sp.]|uniref:thiol reductant ABC exporter subunit CydC n=1 Tax=Mycolicibacterium sp. TaxID=2320850 RepID=UPI0028A99077|nr:thiol reductant ABC exporter subunit CydC [Mycolicibacterium sp.]
MRHSDPLRAALPLLRPRWPRLVLAIVLGSLSLGSALALAAVSAWLITRAWQMPPVLDLSIAVVAVRTLGISRGVLGYCERLVSHDTALRSAGWARGEIYRRLVNGPPAVTARLHSGDLLARVGTDVDTFAEVLVRAFVPIGVAALLGTSSVALIAIISPVVAAVLAGCLLLAGVVAPWLSARAARAQELLARGHHGQRDIAAMNALDHAPELRLAGKLSAMITESVQQQRMWGIALDRASAPMALAVALPSIVVAISTLSAIIVGIGLAPNVAPTTLAVLMLVPLSAFEATSTLPAAATALTRARIAAERLLELAPSAAEPSAASPSVAPAVAPVLEAVALRTNSAGKSDGQLTSLALMPADRLVVTGESGAGKTSLLMTLAGLLSPLSGEVTVGGAPAAALTEGELRSTVCYFAEDAHLFATTVRDNLLVARGDCPDSELIDALRRVGLSEWLAALPEGLDTVLVGGAGAVSAGQRRRLLLARALLCPAPILLLDEPTEHLSAADQVLFLSYLLEKPSPLLGPQRTVVVATHESVDHLDCRRLSVGQGQTTIPGFVPS